MGAKVVVGKMGKGVVVEIAVAHETLHPVPRTPGENPGKPEAEGTRRRSETDPKTGLKEGRRKQNG